MTDVEQMLRSALVPVEPSGALSDRLEQRLSELTGLAAEELAEWELSAMRDPRNWVRPVVATAVGVSAGTVLVVMRVRQQQRRRAAQARNPLDLAGRTVRAAANEARKLARRD